VLLKCFWPAMAIALCLMIAGCGGRRIDQGAVHGEVKLDGKPLAAGSILLAPLPGTKGQASGGPIENGRYQVAGAAVGWNRVEIHGLRKTGKQVLKPFAQHGETVDEVAEAIAPRFNSESDLKIEIKPGENTADFDVLSR
jgi:hypothetical protein